MEDLLKVELSVQLLHLVDTLWTIFAIGSLQEVYNSENMVL